MSSSARSRGRRLASVEYVKVGHRIALAFSRITSLLSARTSSKLSALTVSAHERSNPSKPRVSSLHPCYLSQSIDQFDKRFGRKMWASSDGRNCW